MGAMISTDLQTTGAVLVLAGDLDVRSTSEIRAALYEHLRVHGSYTDGRILVDLSDVTSIDATALKVLAAASRRARRRGGVVVGVRRGRGGEPCPEKAGGEHAMVSPGRHGAPQ